MKCIELPHFFHCGGGGGWLCFWRLTQVTVVLLSYKTIMKNNLMKWNVHLITYYNSLLKPNFSFHMPNNFFCQTWLLDACRMGLYIHFNDLINSFKHYFDGIIQLVPFRDFLRLHLVFLNVIYLAIWQDKKCLNNRTRKCDCYTR